MALDLQRALRGGRVAQALAHELAPARGAHPALDAAAAALLHDIETPAPEAQGRQLARRLALVLQAALLQQHAGAAVFDSFCATRLEAQSDVYGLLPAGTPLDELIARSQPHTH
jgi:putative acyl-CoA dehydrogenase